MSLLTEQEIVDIVRESAKGGATRRDGSTSYRIARAVEAKARAKLIEEIKAQGPVAEFGGLRLTPEGTNEFWGWTIVDSADVLVSRMKLYKLPEGD